jgi:3-oxoacyl-[acyl-carrier protein] reductase
VAVLDEALWDDIVDVNLKGTFLMSQAVIPAMQRQGRGRILCAASFAAIIPSIGGAAYAASKAAVTSFVRVLAGELGPHGITVNAYAPGMIPTDMNHFADLPEARKELLLDTLSLRRWGEKEDVARLICFLASDEAGYITGTTIDVSGGKFATQLPWLAWRPLA